ncbi:unnamed protein product [Paramecium primaurelia]|uniref:Uncharacterized protein n=1 Tax=Paramecium primaurelia TaxID=5886 RepID=A0A8S1KE06_PARPR|nr:unnamed protein product [Paramecium primaurelia]
MDSQAKVSADKRDTLQLFQKVSQSDHKSNNYNNKENMDPQIQSQIQVVPKEKKRRFRMPYEIFSSKKKYEILKLTKQNNNKEYEFVVYDEEQIGIQKEFSEKIRDVYDKDDDVDTTESVLQQLQEICLNDLIDGVRQNQPDSVPNIINLLRLKRHYEILDSDKNEDIKN